MLCLLFQLLFVTLPLKKEQDKIMDTTDNVKKWTRADFLALLERGRQIKARRQKEAEEMRRLVAENPNAAKFL